MSNLQVKSRQLTDEDLKALATSISTQQLVAYILTKFPGNAATATLQQKKKDAVVTDVTIATLANVSLLQCMNIWYLAQSYAICPPINTFNGITKLTEKGYNVQMTDQTVSIKKDHFEYEAKINNGLVQLANTAELVTELEGKFTVSAHAEGIASLSVVLSSLSSIQNGKVKVMSLDETSFLASGVGAIFDRQKYEAGIPMIAMYLEELFKMHSPQLLETDTSVKPTFYGNAYCSHLYDCIFKSVRNDHMQKVPAQNRWIKCLTKHINDMASSGQRMKTLDGKIVNQRLSVDHATLSFSPAPCLFPSSVGQKSLSWERGSSQTLSTSLYILQKCRGVRGADDTERSALARMAYLGVIVSPTIASTMYLVTNLSRFISPATQTLIIYDNDGKSVGPVIHALRTFFPVDRQMNLVCYVKSDVKKMIRQDMGDDDTEPHFYVSGTQIRVLMDMSPSVYVANDPEAGDLVYDARVFAGVNWESPAKHLDYERTVKDYHLARLVEWCKLFKGRPCFGRLPFCSYQREFYAAPSNASPQAKPDKDAPASTSSQAKPDKYANALLNLRNITRDFIDGAPKNGVVSGVELHNLVGWEYSGWEPHLYDENDSPLSGWWYNLNEWDNMLLASQICNMSRVQWAFTRRSPVQRLSNKGLKYPIIDKSYMCKVPVMSLLYDLSEIYSDDTLASTTPEEFEKMLINMEPETIAALKARYDLARDKNNVQENENAGVDGFHAGDDPSLFDAPPAKQEYDVEEVDGRKAM